MRRQRAVNLLCQMYLPCFDREEKEALSMAIDLLNKRGTWTKTIDEDLEKLVEDFGTVYVCSNCKCESGSPWDYCPHCGAKMGDWDR